MLRTVPHVLGIVGSLFLAACATTTATIPQTVYPEVEVKKDEPLVVKEFRGTYGEVLALALEERLAKQGFHVLDRRNMVESAISNGKITPAAYVLSGDLSNERYVEEPCRYSKSTCYPASGKPYDTETMSYNVRASLNGSVRLSRVKDDKVILVKNFAHETSSTGNQSCGSFSPPESRDTLFQWLVNDFALDTLRLLVPYETNVAVELYKVDADLLPDVNAGHDLFKANRLEDALKLYEKAKKDLEHGTFDSKTRGHVLYAYGITLGYLQRPGALEMIDKAYAANPELTYITEMDKLKQFYKKEKTL